VAPATTTTRSWEDFGCGLLRRPRSQHPNGPRDNNMQAGLEAPALPPLVTRSSWKALERHYQEVGKVHLKGLFAGDPDRGKRMTAEAAGVFFHYFKKRGTNHTLGLLVEFGRGAGLRDRSPGLVPRATLQHTQTAPAADVA